MICARARFHTVAAGWGPLEIEEVDQFMHIIRQCVQILEASSEPANAEHPGNDQWHFVDLPLGAGAYPGTDPAPGDPLRPFVGTADISGAR